MHAARLRMTVAAARGEGEGELGGTRPAAQDTHRDTSLGSWDQGGTASHATLPDVSTSPPTDAAPAYRALSPSAPHGAVTSALGAQAYVGTGQDIPRLQALPRACSSAPSGGVSAALGPAPLSPPRAATASAAASVGVKRSDGEAELQRMRASLKEQLVRMKAELARSIEHQQAQLQALTGGGKPG